MEQQRKEKILSMAGEDVEKYEKTKGKKKALIIISMFGYLALLIAFAIWAIDPVLREEYGSGIVEIFSSKARVITTTKTIKIFEKPLKMQNSEVQTVEDIVAYMFIDLGNSGTISSLKKEMKWKVEGSQGNDRYIILATYKDAEFRILVEKQGDYVVINDLANDIESEYNGRRRKLGESLELLNYLYFLQAGSK